MFTSCSDRVNIVCSDNVTTCDGMTARRCETVRKWTEEKCEGRNKACNGAKNKRGKKIKEPPNSKPLIHFTDIPLYNR